MATTLSRKFKVETIWSELVNKRIQQIDGFLKDIQFRNQSGSLLAKGSLKRQIKYVDSDGRIRKTEDRLQFEVIIGTALPEPLPFFTAELKSDYYIFQPRRLGESQALLEQGFTLLIKQIGTVKHDFQSLTILGDVVSGRGEGRAVYSFPVNLKKDDRPKKFSGTVRFERSKTAAVDGIISGVILYRNSHNIIKELEFNDIFGLLIDTAKLNSGQELIVTGKIAALNWLKPIGGQGWIMEANLFYNWVLITSQELSIAATYSESQSNLTINAPTLIKQDLVCFPRSFPVPIPDLESFEANMRTGIIQWKKVSNGLLISTDLILDVYEPEKSGIEVYRSFQFDFQELVADFFQNLETESLILKIEPEISRLKILNHIDQAQIETVLKLSIKVYQSQALNLVAETGAAETIIATVPGPQKTFSFLSEAALKLRFPPAKLIEVKNRLLKINPQLKKGWLNLIGQAEVGVSYIDRHQQHHEEVFDLIIQKSQYWEEKVEESARLELNSKLEYESFKVNDSNISYQYLWTVSVKSFLIREMKVPVSPEAISPKPCNICHPETSHSLQGLSLEGEIPLFLGSPREVACGRALISEFSWRNALNAVLVEGKITGEIEYWDENGYLRQEKIGFSFWRFLPKPVQPEMELTPRLSRYGYYPLRTWPWRKGSVRYQIEIDLYQAKN